MIDETRIKHALEAIDPGSLSRLRGKIPDSEIIGIALCSMDLACTILDGGSYYDYQEQKWVEKEPAEPADLNSTEVLNEIWNAAIQAAVDVCRKETNVLTRQNMPEHATGAWGCANSVSKLMKTKHDPEVKQP